MSVVETIYRERFNDYYVVAQEFDDGKFGVFVFPHNSNVGQLVETVLTRHHALKGAERLHVFYDITISKGYRLQDGYYRDDHGNELHASYTMDLDCTIERIESMLV